MRDRDKNKEQLIEESRALRQQITDMQNRLRQLEEPEARLKRAEPQRDATLEALRTSKARYRNIIESIPMGIHMYRLEPDGRLVFAGANPAADNILGVDNSQFVGKAIEEAFPASTETGLLEDCRRVAATGEPWQIDQVIYQDKQIAGAFQVHAFQTAPAQMAVVFLDITERVQDEQEMRFQKTLLECQSEAAIDGILVVSEDRRWISYNQRFIDIWDIPPDVARTMSSETALRLVQDKLVDPEQFVSKITYLYEHRDEESHDEIALKDGRIFERYSAPVKSTDGMYYGRVWYYREITERKRTEGALRESEERYRVLVEFSSDHIFMLDRDGVYLASNDQVEQFGIMTGQSLVGRHLRDVYTPEIAVLYQQRLEAVFATGQEIAFEHSMPGSRGERQHVDTLYPIWRGGEVWTAGGICHDITERVQVERAMIQASRMEATATLAGGIAHKVNNLMVGVLGYAELLKMDLADQPDAMDMVSVISKSAQQTGELALQMLAFAHGGRSQPQVMNLNDAVQRVIRAQERVVPSGISVELSAAPDLWYVEADPTQMSQIVLNLFTNAVEAIEESGKITVLTDNVVLDETFCLSHSCLKPGPHVYLSVRDTGRGITAENLSKVFEPFFTTKFQGRGLGLAAAYGIVKNHGGFISVESKVGHGATFEVYLRALKTAIEKTSDLERETETAKSVPMAAMQRVLVIEDEESVLEATERMLERLGYRTLVAHSGQEAVDIARTFEGEIHLALLDVRMPGMSGKEVYPLLIEARPELQVIVYSGYEPDEAAQALLDAGASAFIQKPFRMSVLEAETRRALGGQ